MRNQTAEHPLPGYLVLRIFEPDEATESRLVSFVFGRTRTVLRVHTDDLSDILTGFRSGFVDVAVDHSEETTPPAAADEADDD